MFKRLILTLICVITLQGISHAQTTDFKLHQFYPQDFNMWTATGTNSVASGSGTIQVSAPTARITANQGQPFIPFVIGNTILINAGQSDAETVAITAATCNPPSTCSFTATFGSAHTGRTTLNSGDFGLQEAYNAALASGGGIVFIPIGYGGTETQIAAIYGGSISVALVDRRAGSTWTPYTYNGTNFTRSFDLTAANGAILSIKSTSTLVSGAAAATITTGTGAIPAGSLVLGVSTEVVSTFSNTSLTSMTIGDGTDVDRFGATIALTAGTKTTLANWTVVVPPIYPTATAVIMTGTGASFAANGSIRVTVWYISLTAATS